MYRLSDLLKTIKDFAKDKGVSDEEFVNGFLQPYIDAAGIKNRNKEMLFLDKQRVSRIMNNKADVPKAFCRELSRSNIRESTAEGFASFIEDYLDISDEESMVLALRGIIENADNLTETMKTELLGCRNKLNLLLTDLLFAAIRLPNCSPEERKVILQNGESEVAVIVGDLFKYGPENRRKKKNIIVIPCNSSFDTHVTRKLENESKPEVSENTIHGQWLIRWEQSGNSIHELKKRIAQDLESRKIVSMDKGIKKCFPMGTIAVIESNNAIYYLLAISEFDDKNKAYSSEKVIRMAVSELLDFYDSFGQGYDLYLPLIGTGRSRAGLSLQRSFDLLRSVFRENINKIHGNITIVIHNKVKEKILIGENADVIL